MVNLYILIIQYKKCKIGQMEGNILVIGITESKMVKVHLLILMEMRKKELGLMENVLNKDNSVIY